MSMRVLACLLACGLPVSGAFAQQGGIGGSVPDSTVAGTAAAGDRARTASAEAGAAGDGMTAGGSVSVPVVPRDPIMAAVSDMLKTGAAGGTPARAEERELAAYYATAAAPIWTGRFGALAKAGAVMAEIRKADAWGLSAAAFKLPAAPQPGAGAEALAQFEIALSRVVLDYARQASGGRLEPLAVSQQFDRRPQRASPGKVLEAVAGTAAVDGYLRGLHPNHPQFAALRQALLKLRQEATKSEADVRLPDGPLLKAGTRHPHVALLRQRLGLVPARTGPGTAAQDADVMDEALVVALKAYQKANGLSPDGLVGRNTRTALNGSAKVAPEERIETVLANMERWRWMPRDLGAFHVWNNVPEQVSRVLDNGKVVFTENIIVGKRATPTTSFSANMKTVEFQPSWYVPPSIKMNDLRPKLVRAGRFGEYSGLTGGGYSAAQVLARQGLEASYRGRVVDPNRLDWSRVDINAVTFRQPPGARNALGMVKFLFPNKHDIYMHDTPQRYLFKQSSRAYSHGCIRVENPMRFASVLLAKDKGWGRDKITEMARDRDTTRVALTTTVPVHVAYFTAVAQPDGSMRYLDDIYGLDRRVKLALAGRPLPSEPKAVPAVVAGSGGDRRNDVRSARAAPQPRRIEGPAYSYRPSRSSGASFADVFGMNR